METLKDRNKNYLRLVNTNTTFIKKLCLSIYNIPSDLLTDLKSKNILFIYSWVVQIIVFFSAYSQKNFILHNLQILTSQINY